MLPRPPEANVLNPLLWLGQRVLGTYFPAGSGVVANLGNNQYLVTAFHVAKDCDFRPLVRFNGQWNSIDWKTVVLEEELDIAVLKTDTILDTKNIPVRYGEPSGLVFGQIGYALGFPGVMDETGCSTDHIIEVHGKPIPIVALVVANFTAGGNATCSSSYINAGFSGGAVVFPLGKRDWTIAGIITHAPTIHRPVYRNDKETGDFIMEHTGLVRYTSFGAVEKLLKDVAASGKENNTSDLGRPPEA